MNKRELIQAAVAGTPSAEKTPAAFFLHFDARYHSGMAAVSRHAEYFRFTGMDLAKVQFETRFPRFEVTSPEAWASLVTPRLDFYDDQLEVVRGVVDELKSDAIVVVTLYSPFMCAGQMGGETQLDRDLASDPAAVAPALDRLAESLIMFVDECAKAGIDGCYASTQGGEAHRAFGRSVFEEYVRPSEKVVWSRLEERFDTNILHVCDFRGPYDSLDSFADYPGEIVSAPTDLTDHTLTGNQVFHIFGRPFLGGLDRHGEIASGDVGEIRRAAFDALTSGPDAHILGASCTLPLGTDWGNVRTAVQTAHEFPGPRSGS